MNFQNKIDVVAAVLTTRDMQMFIAERADGSGWDLCGVSWNQKSNPKRL